MRNAEARIRALVRWLRRARQGAPMNARREDIVETPIPAASIDALIDLMIAQSSSDAVTAREVSALLMAALALRTARRTGKQVFIVI
jgi:hypothetical protein